jgi:hypothetical protein
MMNQPRALALIGYTSHYFLPFAAALERNGLRVHWIHSLRSFSRTLGGAGIDGARIRDVCDARTFEKDDARAIAELAPLEAPGLPRINDLILMDRRLRTKPYSFALGYLAAAARALHALIDEDGVRCFASGRDTSLQMMSLLVANARGIPWAGAAYMRLPTERFMLTRTHYTDQIYPLGEVTPEHTQAARNYVQSFRASSLRPYVRSSSSSWGGVLKRLPGHFRDGWALLEQSRYDAGNDFARYPLTDIAGMYLRKKLNLLQANLRLETIVKPTGRPYLYFGLHRQPESSVDVLGSWYSDQANLIRTIARSVPVGYDFLVKLHISDADGWPLRFYRELEATPSVKLVHPTADSRLILTGASLTITNSGTMAFEAGLLGRPAITFARVHFNELPTVRYCEAPPKLPALVDEMLARQPAPGDEDAIVEFMSRMFAWSFAGMPNRGVFASALSSQDLDSLVVAYDRLMTRYAPASPRERPR